MMLSLYTKERTVKGILGYKLEAFCANQRTHRNILIGYCSWWSTGCVSKRSFSLLDYLKQGTSVIYITVKDELERMGKEEVVAYYNAQYNNYIRETCFQAENRTRDFKSKWQNWLLHLVAFVPTCISPIWISIIKQVSSVAGYQISTEFG